MRLTDEISTYYKDHFFELSPDKQFHFASRLSAWNNDQFCLDVLKGRTDITQSGDLDAIRADLLDTLHNPPVAKINAAEARQVYFDRYPELRGRILALFRVRHLLYHYNIDARNTFLEICSLDELTSLSTALLQDPEAIKILSTYAINYIYLIHHILFTDFVGATDIATIAHGLGDSYNLASPEQIQLLIYLYTHCIIGESNFYMRGVEEHNDTYLQMIQELEQVIATAYNDINLDNKLEFLVCCQIINYPSELFDRIYQECQESLSPEGTFVVDTINTHKQSNKTSFSDSEHRNVLYIMSASGYPHVTSYRDAM